MEVRVWTATEIPQPGKCNVRRFRRRVRARRDGFFDKQTRGIRTPGGPANRITGGIPACVRQMRKTTNKRNRRTAISTNVLSTDDVTMAALFQTVRSLFFRPALAVAGVSAAVMLVAASALSFRAPTTTNANTGAPATSLASPLSYADSILTTLNEADTTARRFVLTGNSAQRQAFDDAKQRYPAQLARLQERYAGRPEAAPHLLTLVESLVTHFAALDEVIESAYGEDALVGLMLIESETSHLERDKIFAAIQALETIELEQLEQKSNSAAQRVESIQALNAGLIVFVLTLAGTGAWLLFRRVREIEGLITVCAWTRQVRWKGHWMSFEEYLTKRFRLHCTHGICEEAANRLLFEAENPDSAPPFPIGQESASPFPHSASPFPQSASPFPHSASPFLLRPFGSDSGAPFAAKPYGSAPGTPSAPV